MKSEGFYESTNFMFACCPRFTKPDRHGPLSLYVSSFRLAVRQSEYWTGYTVDLPSPREAPGHAMSHAA